MNEHINTVNEQINIMNKQINTMNEQSVKWNIGYISIPQVMEIDPAAMASVSRSISAFTVISAWFLISYNVKVP